MHRRLDGLWMSDNDENARLAEVKAVLRRLQRIASDGDPLGPDAQSRTRLSDQAGGETGGGQPPANPTRPSVSVSIVALDDILPAAVPPPLITISHTRSSQDSRISMSEAAPDGGIQLRATAATASYDKRSRGHRRLLVGGVLAGGLAAVAWAYWQPVLSSVGAGLDTVRTALVLPKPTSVVSLPPPSSAEPAMSGSARGSTIDDVLRGARAELDAGRVQAARAILLAKEAGGSPELALLLARTYDPTVLSLIPNADGQPSSAEAAKWYRTWHERSVTQGQVNQTNALERLLRSLD
jgi:hypothetical protein